MLTELVAEKPWLNLSSRKYFLRKRLESEPTGFRLESSPLVVEISQVEPEDSSAGKAGKLHELVLQLLATLMGECPMSADA